MKDIEIWKDIEGFEGLYQVSTQGRIKSVERYIKSSGNTYRFAKERIMKQQINHKGYPSILLHKESVPYPRVVHRLVAMAFIPNPQNLPQVNHKDTNKLNNRVENLEWMTGEENMRHAFANGCFKTTIKQIEHARKNQKQIVEKRKRAVIMCSDTGEELKVFKSITDAEKETGIRNGDIVRVCKGSRRTAGGYVWKYKEGEK